MTQANSTVTECDLAPVTGKQTPLEFAFQVLSVFGDIERTRLVEIKDPVSLDGMLQFEKGWTAGFEHDLENDSVPIMAPVEIFIDHIRSWLVGFVAGQYASANNMVSPFCNHTSTDHD